MKNKNNNNKNNYNYENKIYRSNIKKLTINLISQYVVNNKISLINYNMIQVRIANLLNINIEKNISEFMKFATQFSEIFESFGIEKI